MFAGQTRYRAWAVALVLALLASLQVWAAPRYEKFNPSTYKGKTGTIQVPYKGDSQLVLYKTLRGRTNYDGMIELRGKGGSLKAPVGNYRTAVFYAVVRERGRATWAGVTNDYISVVVSSAKPCVLKIGPPYTAQVQVRQSGKYVSMYLDMKDCGGRDGGIKHYGRSDTPPGFAVLSKNGRKLWSGKFEYG